MTDYSKALPGHFYAVGIGPGSHDMLTLRAARIIETADVIITPQAEGSAKSLALEAVRPLLNNQEVVLINYKMERNREKTRERWEELAETALEHCQEGKSVAQITLGDPLVFATSSYLMEALEQNLPKENLHTLPGISAFQTIAAMFGDALTLQEDRLTLMSATDIEAVKNALDNCETLVLYKAGGKIKELVEILKERDLLSAAKMVSCAEQGDTEAIVESLDGWELKPLNYMTTMIIRIGNRDWDEGE